MKSQTQGQKVTSNTLGEELKRTLREEITQNFPREIVAQLQGKKGIPQEILPGQSVSPTENQDNNRGQEQKAPFPPLFYQEKPSFVLEKSAAQINNKLAIETLRKEIQEEVEEIRVAFGGLNQELDKSAAQENLLPTRANRNLLSFLENLLKTLRSFRKKIEDSRIWLAVSNQRQRRRHFFWGQAKKSGSKFLLSPDRTPATQIG